MTRVLFLSYYFPPIGGAGVQRSVKFVRYLGELGYEPIVVTGPGDVASRWSPLDESLAAELPSNLEVIRIAAPEPAGSVGWSARRERWLRTRTPFSQWWVDEAVAAGSRVADVDLVYASMSPYETSVAAAALGALHEVPWVADLRDPWALDEMQVFPSGLHRKLERRRMRRSLASAAHVVMNTPESAERLRRLPGFADRAISTIPNGYDAADFAGPVQERNDTDFRIVHSGYLHTQLGQEHRRRRLMRRLLGGSARVDILTRSHVFLLQAIEQLRLRDPAAAARIEVHLVGLSSELDRQAGAGAQIVEHGYRPHAEAVDLLRTADLLFLPMQNLPAGERATIVPGKTYEYLAARRPILAAVPAGDARDLLAEAGGAHVCNPDDVAAMAEAISRELRDESAGAPDPAVVERFERRRLTAELSRVFDSVLGRVTRTASEAAAG